MTRVVNIEKRQNMANRETDRVITMGRERVGASECDYDTCHRRSSSGIYGPQKKVPCPISRLVIQGS